MKHRRSRSCLLQGRKNLISFPILRGESGKKDAPVDRPLAARFEHHVSASRLAQKPFPQPPLLGVVEFAVVESPTRTNEASRSLGLLRPGAVLLSRAARSGAGMASAAGRRRAERRRRDSMI